MSRRSKELNNFYHINKLTLNTSKQIHLNINKKLLGINIPITINIFIINNPY